MTFDIKRGGAAYVRLCPDNVETLLRALEHMSQQVWLVFPLLGAASKTARSIALLH